MRSFLLKNIYSVYITIIFFRCENYFFSVCKKRKRGALMVEYALLIVVCVGMATVLLATIKIDAENGPGQSGWIIQKWWGALEAVAEDT